MLITICFSSLTNTLIKYLSKDVDIVPLWNLVNLVASLPFILIFIFRFTASHDFTMWELGIGTIGGALDFIGGILQSYVISRGKGGP